MGSDDASIAVRYAIRPAPCLRPLTHAAGRTNKSATVLVEDLGKHCLDRIVAKRKAVTRSRRTHVQPPPSLLKFRS